MENILLVGYGGHAKSIADCIERQGIYKIAGYTDIIQQESDYEYLGTDEKLQEYYERGIKKAVIGIGYLGIGEIREKLYNKLKCIGYELPVICDPSAIISSTAINTKALVEHECKVKEFSHIAVAAVLCGQVQVGRAVLVGANATVIQCMDIPDRSIIPAGAVVRKGYFKRGK